MTTTVRIRLLTPTAKPPVYATPGAAGMDLCADITAPLSIWEGQSVPVATGIAVQIPSGFEGQIRPRSGLAFKHGVRTVLGTIDSDYTGEVKVLLEKFGHESFYTIQPGERIAQLVIAPVVRADVEIVAELESTERGARGFGSTGR